MEGNTPTPATPASATPAPAVPASPASPASPALSPPPGEEWRALVAGEEWRALVANKEAFNARIAEAAASGEKKIAKQLGVDIETAKKLIGEAKQREESEKSAAQRALETQAKLEQAEAARNADRGLIEQFAKTELAGLPETLQKYIRSVAGDDPAAQLKAIVAARESGMLQALATPVATPTPVTPIKPPNPATTVAPPGPATPPPTGTLSAFQQHKALVESGQTYAAAQFRNTYRRAIEASTPKP